MACDSKSAFFDKSHSLPVVLDSISVAAADCPAVCPVDEWMDEWMDGWMDGWISTADNRQRRSKVWVVPSLVKVPK